MRAPTFSAAVTTAVVLTASLCLTGAASAADLYGERYGEPAYDQRGYAEDIDDGRYGEAPTADAYQEPYDAAEPLPGSVKDGYPVPMPPHASAPPPPRYVERPPLRAKHYDRYACLDRWQIRRELRRDGWGDIRPMGGDGGIVHMRARRMGEGRLFHLRVDRCSGEVLAARPHHRGVAYRDWRWVK